MLKLQVTTQFDVLILIASRTGTHSDLFGK